MTAQNEIVKLILLHITCTPSITRIITIYYKDIPNLLDEFCVFCLTFVDTLFIIIKNKDISGTSVFKLKPNQTFRKRYIHFLHLEYSIYLIIFTIAPCLISNTSRYLAFFLHHIHQSLGRKNTDGKNIKPKYVIATCFF